MYQDLFLQMDYNRTFSTSIATNSYIDMLAAGDAMPGGSLPVWTAICLTTPAGSTAFSATSTLTFQLQTSPNTLFDSNAITLAQSVIPLTSVVASTANVAPAAISGTMFAIPLPAGCLRYVRGYYLLTAAPAFSTNPGFTQEIVMDQDKLITPTLGLLQK